VRLLLFRRKRIAVSLMEQLHSQPQAILKESNDQILHPEMKIASAAARM